MKSRDVRVGPMARADVGLIADYIAIFVSPTNGEEFIDRIFDFIWRLDLASQRGIDRGDIYPGLRVIAFERRANIAVLLTPSTATVIRVFHRGQDWESALRPQFGAKD